MLRWATVAALVPVLAGLVAVFGRFERAPARVPVGSRSTSSTDLGPWTTVRLFIAVGLLSLGFTVVALQGLSHESTPFGLPLAALALIGTGSVLAVVPPRRTLRPAAQPAARILDDVVR
jgi:hypothetical protein